MEEVAARLRRKNKILFTRESGCLQELLQLIAQQRHRTLVLWAFDCVQKPSAYILRLYPSSGVDKAIALCDSWAQGHSKMAVAKRAILDVHAYAKSMDNAVDVAITHAIAQGLSTVHVETHAIGLALYELSAIVLANEEYEVLVNKKIQYYIERLLYWQSNEANTPREWASFLADDTKINKEFLHQQKKKMSK